MKKRSKSKLVMTLLLAVILIPGMAVLFCHCCEASPVNQAVIQQTPCHSCCGNTNIFQSVCKGLNVQKVSFLNPFENLFQFFKSFLGNQSLLKIINPVSFSESIGIFGVGPNTPFNQPLYLLNQNFRI